MTKHCQNYLFGESRDFPPHFVIVAIQLIETFSLQQNHSEVGKVSERLYQKLSKFPVSFSKQLKNSFQNKFLPFSINNIRFLINNFLVCYMWTVFILFSTQNTTLLCEQSLYYQDFNSKATYSRELTKTTQQYRWLK